MMAPHTYSIGLSGLCFRHALTRSVARKIEAKITTVLPKNKTQMLWMNDSPTVCTTGFPRNLVRSKNGSLQTHLLSHHTSFLFTSVYKTLNLSAFIGVF